MVGRILHSQSGDSDGIGAFDSYRLGLISGGGGISLPQAAADHYVGQSVIPRLRAVSSLKHTSAASAVAQNCVVTEYEAGVGIDHKALDETEGAASKSDRNRCVCGGVVTREIQRCLNRLSVVLCVAAVCSEALG